MSFHNNHTFESIKKEISKTNLNSVLIISNDSEEISSKMNKDIEKTVDTMETIFHCTNATIYFIDKKKIPPDYQQALESDTAVLGYKKGTDFDHPDEVLYGLISEEKNTVIFPENY